MCYFKLCYFQHIIEITRILEIIRFIGKGEVESSIPSGSTILPEKA